MTTALSAAAATRLGADPRLHPARPRDQRSPTRPRIRTHASNGQHHAQHLEDVRGDVDESAVPPGAATPAASSLTTAQAVPSRRGTAATSASSISAIIGIVTSTQAVITARAHGLRTRFSGSDHRCGSSPSSVGRIRW